jgi:hypothetical protein
MGFSGPRRDPHRGGRIDRPGPHALAADLRPLPDEGWRDKLVRARLALANARTGASHHYATLQGLRRERG